MRVAAVQFRPEFAKKAENLSRAASLVVEAASAGAELIVLPELCTTGYSFMSQDEAAPFAETIEKGATTYEVMESLVSRLGIAVAWGMVEADKGTGDLYNTQVLLGDFGHITYRKVNPWANDYLWAKCGRANPPITTFKGKKVGLLICRDVRDRKDDKWKSFYEKGDADIVCLSANWGNGGFPSVTWMDFAKDNHTTLIVSNRWGKEANNDFGEGGVCVIYPDQRVVCEGLVWNRDCIVYSEV
jgi:predicted amidohydrolase